MDDNPYLSPRLPSTPAELVEPPEQSRPTRRHFVLDPRTSGLLMLFILGAPMLIGVLVALMWPLIVWVLR